MRVTDEQGEYGPLASARHSPLTERFALFFSANRRKTGQIDVNYGALGKVVRTHYERKMSGGLTIRRNGRDGEWTTA